MKKGIVVTTEIKGVFFGYVEDGDLPSSLPAEITLSQARMCVYWHSDVRGVLGLAATGPTESCRISRAVPEIKIYRVTAVITCTPEAIENWEKGLWG